MNLIEFLLARIAEDEAAANLAVDTATAPNVYFHWLRVQRNDMREWMDDWPTNYTPARVLAECEAKRRIVDTYVAPGQSPHPGQDCDNGGGYEPCELHEASWQRQHHSEWVLRLLALPYADHPDFREEWRP